MTVTQHQGIAFPTVLSRSVAVDVDGYRAAVAGVDIDAVASGAGSGPNDIRVVSDGRITSTSVRIGFPILTRASVGDDRFIVASIQSAPPGSRWRDIDLHPGAVITYNPSAEHTATNLPGLEFTFVVASVDELLERGEQLKIDLRAPDRGGVTELPRGPRVSTIARQLATLAAMPDQHAPTPRPMDELLSSMAGTLAPLGRPTRERATSMIDDRSITGACIDHAEAIARRPSMAELCIAASVSERRVRTAFMRQYDTPPSVFFRAWALTEARRRLSPPEPSSVTDVALALGFGHIGRFARYYRQVNGEWPSATLRSGLIGADNVG